MATKPRIRLPHDLIDRSMAYGIGVCDGYSRGRNRASRAVSSHGAEMNPKLQAMARAGECAAAIYFKRDPLKDLDWSPRCDPGHDVFWFEFPADVKTTQGHYRLLIWPVRKNAIFEDKKFDFLVLVKFYRPEFEMTGFLSKTEFAAKRQTAGRNHRLTEGTWFVDQDELHEF